MAKLWQRRLNKKDSYLDFGCFDSRSCRTGLSFCLGFTFSLSSESIPARSKKLIFVSFKSSCKASKIMVNLSDCYIEWQSVCLRLLPDDITYLSCLGLMHISRLMFSSFRSSRYCPDRRSKKLSL